MKRARDQVTSLDAQIAALERELDVGGDTDDEENVDYEGVDEKSVVEETGEDGKLVKMVSKSLLKHRIAPLPSSLLPSATCGKSSHGSGAERKQEKPARTRVKFEEPKSREPVAAAAAAGMSGAEKTIREMLRNYKSSGGERKPFWCRVCKFQGHDEASLLEHRETEFHKLAVSIETKMCYCKLCRKQCVSLEQLKEHLGGKLHKDTLISSRDRGKMTS